MTEPEKYEKAILVVCEVCDTLNNLCKDLPRGVYLEAVRQIHQELEFVIEEEDEKDRDRLGT